MNPSGTYMRRRERGRAAKNRDTPIAIRALPWESGIWPTTAGANSMAMRRGWDKTPFYAELARGDILGQRHK